MAEVVKEAVMVDENDVDQQPPKHRKRTKPRRVSGNAAKNASVKRGLGLSLLVERNDSMDRLQAMAMVTKSSSTRGLGLDIDDTATKLTRRPPPTRTGSFGGFRGGVGRSGSFKYRLSMKKKFARRGRSARNFNETIPMLERSDSMNLLKRSMMTRRSISLRKGLVAVDPAELSTDDDNDTVEDEEVIEVPTDDENEN